MYRYMYMCRESTMHIYMLRMTNNYYLQRERERERERDLYTHTFMKSSGWGAPFHAPLSYTKSDGDIKFAEYSEPHLAMGMCAGSGLCLSSRGSELSVRTWGLPATTCTQHVNTCIFIITIILFTCIRIS